ncbi:MAG TPA: SH3 domain-containing protein [Dehalococcoidia bacterium]|nr:SH3 domain-containing protein [Dehalococcoidia bacterium]
MSVTFLAGFGVGSFVGVLLALLAVAVARPEDTKAEQTAIVSPTAQATTASGGPIASPTPTVRTKAALEVHIGPGSAYAVVGTVPRNDPVDVLGKSTSEDWVAIRFPPGSTARGWVEADDLSGLSDTQLDKLAVLQPTPLASSVATPSAGGGGTIIGSNDGGGRSNGGGTSPLATATPGPATGPTDLLVSRISVLSDGRVAVTIGNRGPGDFTNRSVFVQVRDLGISTETLSLDETIKAGGTATLTTSIFRVVGEGDVIATVDPGATISDPVRSNNTLTQTLAPIPTPTPVITPTAAPQR